VPAFYARSNDFAVDCRVESADEVAAIIAAKWHSGLEGGLVIAVPVPEEFALESDEINTVIDNAIVEMRRQEISGKDTTPFLLARIAENTGGKSLEANIQLVINNARVASEIAGCLSNEG
jgi:pseudouridine-5'-phosphate glycosidase